ncbi:hypothetical protein ACHAWF_000918 [Thalassiosira exigua]
MLLYTRSVMYDLGIPQGAASLLYEDNNATIAISNVRIPASQTRHIDICHFTICEWVERDLLMLSRIDTTRNMADHFTKQPGPILVKRHTDYVRGHVPPSYSPCYRHFITSVEERLHLSKKTKPIPLPDGHPAAAAAT